MAAIKRSLNVGVVGMGRMGVPIARNLAFKSRNAMYLQLHSRQLARARKVCDDLAVDGAQCAMRLHSKYSTMTKWCDVILTVLADVQASRYAMLEAPDALIRNAKQGQVLVDHTTLDVETAREYEDEARRRGAIFLDAPLSGSPQAALNGQLTLMAGGEEEAFLKMVPLFRLYGDTIHRMGHVGSGSATKGIISMLVAVHSLAAAEALTMAHATGIDDSENLLKVLDASWGSSTILRRNAAMTQRMLRNPDQPPPVSSATMTSLLTDLGLFDKGAALNSPEIGDAHYPLLHQSCNVLARGVMAGVGDRDIAGVVHFLESAGLPTAPLPVEDEPAESAPTTGTGSTDEPRSRKMSAHLVDEVEFY